MTFKKNLEKLDYSK